jgi:uncharacterized protein YndB with AHSA1/START domain
MNNLRKLALLLTVAGLALLVVPTFAAGSATKSLSISETTINKSYWVTNPAWRAVTDRSVDLQPGQVVVSEMITQRGHDPVAVDITYTPAISNGRIFWTATAMMHDGKPVSDDLLNQINNHMNSSWAHYIREHRAPGYVAAITITDDSITITLTKSTSK